MRPSRRPRATRCEVKRNRPAVTKPHLRRPRLTLIFDPPILPLSGSVSLAASVSRRCPNDSAICGRAIRPWGRAQLNRAANTPVALTLEARWSSSSSGLFLLAPQSPAARNSPPKTREKKPAETHLVGEVNPRIIERKLFSAGRLEQATGDTASPSSQRPGEKSTRFAKTWRVYRQVRPNAAIFSPSSRNRHC